VITNDERGGRICDICRDKAISQFIAAREAEKPKAPTLENKMHAYLNTVGLSAHIDTVKEIIAIVREHAATALKPTTPNDVLQLRVEVLTRDLRERTAELQIAREMIDGKQAKIDGTECPTCEGLGEVPSGVEEFGQQEIIGCPDCMGTGRIRTDEIVTP
jgi:hypothetical protein